MFYILWFAYSITPLRSKSTHPIRSNLRRSSADLFVRSVARCASAAVLMPGELAIQWRYVSSHFSRKWGESQTNERFQKIIAAWSETLSISLFDNGCA